MTSNPISDALASAKSPAADRRARAVPVRPGSNGGESADWDEIGLPDGCPVRAVGLKGASCIFLDANHQLTFADPPQLGESWLTLYFGGDVNYMIDYWPKWGAKDGVKTFAAEKVRRSIQMACSDAGIWDDMERVRGRGCWRDDETGQLIVHCGDVIYFPDGQRDPGVHQGRVYPGRAHIMEPASERDVRSGPDDPGAGAQRVLGLLRTWNWRRPHLDPLLYLGLIVGAMAGGALDWRPSGWVTGESGCGKSTLLKLRRELLGGWSINASNATPAGIYARVEYDAIGVTLDEQENSSKNDALMKMIELARDAASGDAIVRSNAKHGTVSFRARNSFQFASIRAAPLRKQDLNRIPQLELREIPAGSAEPDWTPLEAISWGREILRRLMMAWPRWDATLKEWRAQLKRLGHDSRGADTFGTLLALADLVLTEDGFFSLTAEPYEHIEQLLLSLTPAQMAEYMDSVKDWESCLETLLASRPKDWKTGAPASIGGACREGIHIARMDGVRAGEKEVNGLLAMCGCRLHSHPKEGWRLFVVHEHPGLLSLFQDTDWKGQAGASPPPWNRSLIRAGEPRAYATKMSVDGVQKRGVSVCIDDLIDVSDREGRTDDE